MNDKKQFPEGEIFSFEKNFGHIGWCVEVENPKLNEGQLAIVGQSPEGESWFYIEPVDITRIEQALGEKLHYVGKLEGRLPTMVGSQPTTVHFSNWESGRMIQKGEKGYGRSITEEDEQGEELVDWEYSCGPRTDEEIRRLFVD